MTARCFRSGPELSHPEQDKAPLDRACPFRDPGSKAQHPAGHHGGVSRARGGEVAGAPGSSCVSLCRLLADPGAVASAPSGCHECPTPTRGTALAGDIKPPPLRTRPPTALATGAAAAARWAAPRCCRFSLRRPAGPAPPQPSGASALSGAVAGPGPGERAGPGCALRAFVLSSPPRGAPASVPPSVLLADALIRVFKQELSNQQMCLKIGRLSAQAL